MRTEGQRKALFEVCETERKINSEEIQKFKKSISDLAVSLEENKSDSAKFRTNSAQLESAIGPIGQKTSREIKTLFDLQIIDKSKQLDLLRYKKKRVRKNKIVLDVLFVCLFFFFIMKDVGENC